MGQVLQVNGFTRSGTTYTYTAVKLAFPQFQVEHSHNYLDLSWRVKTNQPTIACVRNPIDTLVSSLIQRNIEKSNQETIKQCIKKYTQHLYIINSVKDNTIVSFFDDVIKDFNPLLQAVSERYNCKLMPISKEDIVVEIPKYGSNEDLRFGRLPRNNIELKQYALNRLNEPNYSELLNKATDLYNKIRDK
jgi:hypothetical protein